MTFNLVKKRKWNSERSSGLLYQRTLEDGGHRRQGSQLLPLYPTFLGSSNAGNLDISPPGRTGILHFICKERKDGIMLQDIVAKSWVRKRDVASDFVDHKFPRDDWSNYLNK